METTIQHSQSKTKNETVLQNWFNNQCIKFESSRFFWMAAFMIIQSCWGSVACGFILQNHAHILFLCICAGITMASNAVFIAQGSAKLCLSVFYASVVLNTVFVIMNV